MDHGSLSQVNLLLPFEDQIPFVPLLIVLYMSIYIMPTWIFLSISRKGRIFKILLVFLTALCIHLMFFVLMPVEYVLRPQLHLESQILQNILSFLYTVDAPINTFPSMHVSFAFISYYIMRRYRPQWERVFLILAVAISLSTVFVKQHYVLDVVSGVMIAVFLNYFIIEKKFPSFVRRG